MKKVVRIVRVWKFRLIKNALPFPAIYWATALAIKRSSSCVACQNEEKKIYLSFKWRRLFTTGVLPYRDKLTKFWLLTVSRTNDSAENRDGKNKTRSVFWYSKEGKGARRAKRWATKLNFVFSIFFSFIFAIFFFFFNIRIGVTCGTPIEGKNITSHFSDPVGWCPLNIDCENFLPPKMTASELIQ